MQEGVFGRLRSVEVERERDGGEDDAEGPEENQGYGNDIQGSASDQVERPFGFGDREKGLEKRHISMGYLLDFKNGGSVAEGHDFRESKRRFSVGRVRSEIDGSDSKIPIEAQVVSGERLFPLGCLIGWCDEPDMFIRRSVYFLKVKRIEEVDGVLVIERGERPGNHREGGTAGVPVDENEVFRTERIGNIPGYSQQLVIFPCQQPSLPG